MGMITFITDPHIDNHRAFGGALTAGINERCMQARNVLRQATRPAQRAHDEPLVVLGDLFDTPAPTPQVISAVSELLDGTPTTLLVGNHEMVSSVPGDHALGPLIPVVDRVVDRPGIIHLADADLIMLPYRAGRARDTLADEVGGLIGKPGKGSNPLLLCLHYGIFTPDDPDYMRSASDAVPLSLVNDIAKRHNISAVFAGHWHRHRILQQNIPERPRVIQVGALVPTGWDNPGVEGYGSVVQYDTLRGEVLVEHLPGPRFLNWKWPPSAVEVFQPQGKGEWIYIRVTAPPDRLADAKEWIAELKVVGKIADGEAVPDEEPAKEAARKAAESARSAETLAEALAEFVGAMPLPEGVDRAEVLIMARKYLEGGAA